MRVGQLLFLSVKYNFLIESVYVGEGLKGGGGSVVPLSSSWQHQRSALFCCLSV